MKRIALLRGINVAGQKKVPMVRLKALFEQLGFTNVQTYIQSGNVVFNSGELNNETLCAQIEKAIESTFAFTVPCLVLSHTDLQQALLENPFTDALQKEHKGLYFTFLAKEPSVEHLTVLQGYAFPNEALAYNKRLVYFFSEAAYGTAKFNNNFIEQKLKVQATTRNLKTVKHLLTMLTN